MKYLNTNTFITGNRLKALKELGYKGFHNQFRIICLCKSVADANKKCEEVGFGYKVFRQGWYSETGNKKEIEVCDKYGIAIKIDQTDIIIGVGELDNYVDNSKKV
jgi:hypothetical protein